MKGTILLIALLMISIFAGVVVLADDDDNASTDDDEAGDVEDVEVEGVDSEDVENVLEDLETPKNYKKVGFVNVWTANGWLENGEIGTLVNGFWAVQKFIKTNGEEVKVVRAHGELNIAGYGKFKLARIHDGDEDNNTISFYLVKSRKNYDTESDLASNSIGRLDLTKESEYKGLTTWNGELTIDNGEHSGTYDVELGTKVRTLKPRQAAAIADASQAAQKTFWKRIQFWKNLGGNKPGNSDNNSALEGPRGQANTAGIQANAKPIKATSGVTGGAIFN